MEGEGPSQNIGLDLRGKKREKKLTHRTFSRFTDRSNTNPSDETFYMFFYGGSLLFSTTLNKNF